MRRVRIRRVGAVAAAALLSTALIGVGAGGAGAQGDGRPGVTNNEIRVGGVAGKTNPVGQPYVSGFDGVEAYFDYVNGQGGVFDRKLKLVAELDDQSRASQNVAQCRSLVEEEKVFAVLPVVTQIFACGQYLADQGVPTFGWNINAEWCSTATNVQEINARDEQGAGLDAGRCDRTNLIAEKGSYLCFTCPQIAPPFIATQLGLTKVGVMSYTAPQSVECSKGMIAGFERFGLDVVFEDTSLAFGFSNLGDAVEKIQDSGVEFIGTCMDIAGEVNIIRNLRRAGLDDIKFYAPQGYDPGTLEKYRDELNGVFFGIEFVPFEDKSLPPGMKLFLKQMKKLDKPANEQAVAGWQNAALLVAGIEAAGPDFTQQSVLDAIAGISDWTADGIRVAIDWGPTGSGHGPGVESCTAYVEAKNGKFVPRFGKKGQPFVCFPLVPLAENFDSPVYKPELTTDTTTTTASG
jgi:branched-chain amino acid transport system substrate-binding protein